SVRRAVRAAVTDKYGFPPPCSRPQELLHAPTGGRHGWSWVEHREDQARFRGRGLRRQPFHGHPPGVATRLPDRPGKSTSFTRIIPTDQEVLARAQVDPCL